MKRSTFFTLNTLGTKRGGLVKAVIKRANTIAAAEPDRLVHLLTLGLQTQIDSIRDEMIKLNLLYKRVHVTNLIHTLGQQKPDNKQTKSYLLKRLNRQFVVFDDSSRAENDSYRVFDNGVYVQYLRFDALDRLVFIDYFSETRHRLKREEYLENGQLFQIIHYSMTTNKPVSRQFLHGNGTCYLTIWHKMNSADWSHLFYFEKNEQLQFNDPATFYTFALNRFLGQYPAVLLSSEFRDRLPNLPKRNLDAVVLDVSHPNIRKIAFGHSNHFVSPFDETATISGVWNTLFKRIDEWSAVITATSRQAEHMKHKFGHESLFHSIPHAFTNKSEDSLITDPVNPNRFVVVSRIQIKKDVAESIRAMRKIVDYNPNAFLDFYGFGYNDQLEKDLLALIKELSLTDHIHFKGFVTDMREAYAGAVATLFTSQSEGFGMAILESMSYGIPVIAYDICYGPAEIIQDHITGRLIPKRDTEKFAEAAIDLMKHPDARQLMGSRAAKALDPFSEQQYEARWVNLLDKLDTSIN
ncbi:glycosyltransferase [Exiguobacterium artemiae]